MSAASSFDVATLADEMKSAQDATRQIAPFSSRFAGFDVAAGYAVAAQVHALRTREGDVAVGRKIGFTNPAVQREYNVREPVWGTIYKRTFISLDPADAPFAIGHLAQPRIEPEIVLHFKSSPPVNGDPDAILACIDWVAHGFEIVQSNYPDWKFRAADAVADNGMHGALLIGKPQPVATLGDDLVRALETFSLLLTCDGQLRDSGTGANVFGNPLKAISHLTKVLARQGMLLQAGEVVTTGTITSAPRIRAGETWSTEVSGISLPGIRAEFG